ncbi:hypothetical protein [Halarchaeum salinum]|uniref:Uncharacterized protein n=1 Tax=Halarchaeum salinum TaxID=489912 RepID=A0AAV3S474_9EURY
MKEPREELQADAAERRNAPDFDALTPPEDVVRGGTRDVYDRVDWSPREMLPDLFERDERVHRDG